MKHLATQLSCLACTSSQTDTLNHSDFFDIYASVLTLLRQKPQLTPPSSHHHFTPPSSHHSFTPPSSHHHLTPPTPHHNFTPPHQHKKHHLSSDNELNLLLNHSSQHTLSTQSSHLTPFEQNHPSSHPLPSCHPPPHHHTPPHLLFHHQQSFHRNPPATTTSKNLRNFKCSSLKTDDSNNTNFPDVMSFTNENIDSLLNDINNNLYINNQNFKSKLSYEYDDDDENDEDEYSTEEEEEEEDEEKLQQRYEKHTDTSSQTDLSLAYLSQLAIDHTPQKTEKCMGDYEVLDKNKLPLIEKVLQKLRYESSYQRMSQDSYHGDHSGGMSASDSLEDSTTTLQELLEKSTNSQNFNPNQHTTTYQTTTTHHHTNPSHPTEAHNPSFLHPIYSSFHSPHNKDTSKETKRKRVVPKMGMALPWSPNKFRPLYHSGNSSSSEKGDKKEGDEVPSSHIYQDLIFKPPQGTKSFADSSHTSTFLQDSNHEKLKALKNDLEKGENYDPRDVTIDAGNCSFNVKEENVESKKNNYYFVLSPQSSTETHDPSNTTLLSIPPPISNKHLYENLKACSTLKLDNCACHSTNKTEEEPKMRKKKTRLQKRNTVVLGEREVLGEVGRADVMYTNRQNLQHTIHLQQLLFQQLLNLTTSQQHPPCQHTTTTLNQQNITPPNPHIPPPTNLHQQTTNVEWVIKKRKDGTRYICRKNNVKTPNILPIIRKKSTKVEGDKDKKKKPKHKSKVKNFDGKNRKKADKILLSVTTI